MRKAKREYEKTRKEDEKVKKEEKREEKRKKREEKLMLKAAQLRSASLADIPAISLDDLNAYTIPGSG